MKSNLSIKTSIINWLVEWNSIHFREIKSCVFQFNSNCSVHSRKSFQTACAHLLQYTGKVYKIWCHYVLSLFLELLFCALAGFFNVSKFAYKQNTSLKASFGVFHLLSIPELKFNIYVVFFNLSVLIKTAKQTRNPTLSFSVNFPTKLEHPFSFSSANFIPNKIFRTDKKRLKSEFCFIYFAFHSFFQIIWFFIWLEYVPQVGDWSDNFNVLSIQFSSLHDHLANISRRIPVKLSIKINTLSIQKIVCILWALDDRLKAISLRRGFWEQEIRQEKRIVFC